MEEWKIDFEWLRIRHFVKKRFGHRKLPDMQTVLFLVGIQELGQVRSSFEKEEKVDLIQLGAIAALETLGYYSRLSTDPEGWPVYKLIKPPPKMELNDQTDLLKEAVVYYFIHHELLEED